MIDNKVKPIPRNKFVYTRKMETMQMEIKCSNKDEEEECYNVNGVLLHKYNATSLHWDDMFVDNEFPKKNEKVCPMNYDDP
jgi:NAD kinase